VESTWPKKGIERALSSLALVNGVLTGPWVMTDLANFDFQTGKTLNRS